jgi:N-acetylneuraminic acid mutarotase
VLYCFDTISLKWVPKPKVSGHIPGARDGHTACNINNCMYIFGGYEEDTDRFSNDVYVLDLKSYVWKYVTVRGIPPSWRDFHSAVAFDNKMFVFGGRSDRSGPYHSQQEIYYNSINYLDTTTNTWIQPVTSGVLPNGRRSHSAFVYNNCIFIFGGYNGSINKHFNDMYKYDPQTRVWSLVEAKGKSPCPRRRQSCCIVGDRLFLFGGTRFAFYQLFLFSLIIN